jgi:molybdenum cofactor cytidylyltransferase
MKSEKSNSEVLFTEKKKIDAVCIIPAAGLSSRMGCWKAELLSKEGLFLSDNAVMTAREACREVIVVGGYQFSSLKKLITPHIDVRIVENRDYNSGMLGSIQAGLKYVKDDFFIFPMDMPLIVPEHFFRISKIWEKDRVTRPIYRNIPGHPVVFPQDWKDKILAMEGISLRKSIQWEDQDMIPWEDESVIFDMDSEVLYQAYLNS